MTWPCSVITSTDLYVYVNGAEDTTLLVNRLDGGWVCDDEGLGDSNPVVVIPTPAGGLYNIWVGYLRRRQHARDPLYLRERSALVGAIVGQSLKVGIIEPAAHSPHGPKQEMSTWETTTPAGG